MTMSVDDEEIIQQLREPLKTALRQGEVEVTFTKTGGEVRTMRCTTSLDLIPEQPAKDPGTTTKTKRPNPDVQAVWDLDKGAWRSFRFDSIQRWSA
jgi:hypothetical protein